MSMSRSFAKAVPGKRQRSYSATHAAQPQGCRSRANSGDAVQRNLRTIAALLLVSGCANPVPSPVNLADASESSTDSDAPDPSPSYREKEGDRYFYVTEVSEEDKNKGKAAGDVVEYRYLGEQGGLLTLEEVTENGTTLGRLECQRACRIMKFTGDGQVSRIPYGNDSIASAAMRDAINGFLKPVREKAGPVIVKHIPAAFIGRWNPEPSDCGTGDNDGAVFVAPEKLTFYESGLDVTSVQLLGPDKVKVAGPLTDEEGSVMTMAYTLSLLDGKLLVDDKIARTRCPD